MARQRTSLCCRQPIHLTGSKHSLPEWGWPPAADISRVAGYPSGTSLEAIRRGSRGLGQSQAKNTTAAKQVMQGKGARMPLGSNQLPCRGETRVASFASVTANLGQAEEGKEPAWRESLQPVGAKPPGQVACLGEQNAMACTHTHVNTHARARTGACALGAGISPLVRRKVPSGPRSAHIKAEKTGAQLAGQFQGRKEKAAKYPRPTGALTGTQRGPGRLVGAH